MMNRNKIVNTTSKLATIIFISLIAYLPFHIFISTVVGVNIGGLEFFKAAKDLVIVLIALLTLPYILANFDSLKKSVIKDRLIFLCFAYISVNVLYFIINNRDLDSALLGLVYNTRYIVLFLSAGVLAKATPDILNVRLLTRVVIWSGFIVSVLGILQYFVIPKDFLSRIGYSMQNGVLPWFYIDGKPDFFRIMSTMRDPNSLGSYLLIPISLIAAKLSVNHKTLTKKTKAYLSTVLLVHISALILAFSRSAVVGLLVSLCTLAILIHQKYLRSNIKKVTIITVFASLVIVLVGGIFMQANPRAFQNIIFHADEQTVQRDPNELRIDFIQGSAEEIAQNPLGNGLGTAGLASMKNQETGANLTENYYLQLAIEIGLVGMFIFLAICYLTTKRLVVAWNQSNNFVPVALVSSFAGLFITNMLAHIWTNETIAVTWWGLAAVCIIQFLYDTPKHPKRKRSPKLL